MLATQFCTVTKNKWNVINLNKFNILHNLLTLKRTPIRFGIFLTRFNYITTLLLLFSIIHQDYIMAYHVRLVIVFSILPSINFWLDSSLDFRLINPMFEMIAINIAHFLPCIFKFLLEYLLLDIHFVNWYVLYRFS